MNFERRQQKITRCKYPPEGGRFSARSATTSSNKYCGNGKEPTICLQLEELFNVHGKHLAKKCEILCSNFLGKYYGKSIAVLLRTPA